MHALKACQGESLDGSLALRDVIDVEAAVGLDRMIGAAREQVEDGEPGKPLPSEMEEAIRSAAMERLAGITASAPKLHRLQAQRIELARKRRTCKRRTLTPWQSRGQG